MSSLEQRDRNLTMTKEFLEGTPPTRLKEKYQLSTARVRELIRRTLEEAVGNRTYPGSYRHYRSIAKHREFWCNCFSTLWEKHSNSNNDNKGIQS